MSNRNHNNNNSNKKKKPAAKVVVPPRQVRAAIKQALTAKPAPRRRWGLSLGALSAGPVSLKGLNLSSRSQRSRQVSSYRYPPGWNRDRSVAITAPSARTVQTSMPRFISTTREDGVQADVLEGTDFIASITTGDGPRSAGDVLIKQLINPVAFLTTRVAQFAPLYQRYRFTRIEFVYEPIANAMQSGQLLGFSDFDVDVELEATGASNLQRGAAHQGQRINQIWEEAVYPMGQAPSFTDLFVNPAGEDPRLSYQGVFYLLAASDLNEDLALGNLYIRYRLELTIPQLQGALGTPAAALYTVNGYSGGAQFGNTITKYGPGTMQVTRPSSTTLSIAGVTTGALIMVAMSGTGTASGLTIGSSGPVATWTGASAVHSGGACANFTTGFHGVGWLFIARVTATSGPITLQVTTTTATTAGTYTVMLQVATIPDVASGLELRRQRTAALDALASVLASDSGGGFERLLKALTERPTVRTLPPGPAASTSSPRPWQDDDVHYARAQ